MIGTTIYSGYLNAAKPGRQIHYMFVQANVSDPSTAPLTLWLNGGPGCSSLIGMLQEIGPYIVGNSYKQGDLLTKNEYGWHKVSNLLFLESPATVGFSSDKDKQYAWTDEETAMDAFTALKDFLFNKAAEFSNRSLFVILPSCRSLVRATPENTCQTSPTSSLTTTQIAPSTTSTSKASWWATGS